MTWTTLTTGFDTLVTNDKNEKQNCSLQKNGHKEFQVPDELDGWTIGEQSRGNLVSV